MIWDLLTERECGQACFDPIAHGHEALNDRQKFWPASLKTFPAVAEFVERIVEDDIQDLNRDI